MLRLSPLKVAAAVVILGCTLFLGVLSAVIIASTDLKTAAMAGLAYQSTLAAAAKAAEAR